jgi:hypothetical protein
MKISKTIKYFFFSFFILSTPQIFERFPKISEVLKIDYTIMGISLAHIIFATAIILIVDIITEK